MGVGMGGAKAIHGGFGRNGGGGKAGLPTAFARRAYPTDPIKDGGMVGGE